MAARRPTGAGVGPEGNRRLPFGIGRASLPNLLGALRVASVFEGALFEEHADLLLISVHSPASLHHI
jgi:hypothetical protein